MRRQWFVLMAVLALAGVACGDDGDPVTAESGDGSDLNEVEYRSAAAAICAPARAEIEAIFESFIDSFDRPVRDQLWEGDFTDDQLAEVVPAWYEMAEDIYPIYRSAIEEVLALPASESFGSAHRRIEATAGSAWSKLDRYIDEQNPDWLTKQDLGPGGEFTDPFFGLGLSLETHGLDACAL